MTIISDERIEEMLEAESRTRAEIERLTAERDAAQGNADANCKRWVEAMAENERLRALLDSLLGDKAMSEALWGKLPDDATMTITIKLGAYRKAQSVRHTFQQLIPQKE